MAFSNDESVWNAFLAEWPLERLRTMSLEEYTKAGDKHSFVYWMEGGLDQYGSIWGGSAFKFGIYSRNEHSLKQGDTASAYDADYGWYRRFGDTHDAAFEAVRREVVAVAEAARASRWSDIDKSEFGPSYLDVRERCAGARFRQWPDPRTLRPLFPRTPRAAR